jgi:hypothetical protein
LILLVDQAAADDAEGNDESQVMMACDALDQVLWRTSWATPTDRQLV